MSLKKPGILLFTFFLLSIGASAQLLELEVTQVDKPNRAIPVFTNYPEAAAIIIKSSIPYLQFDSNIGLVADLSEPGVGEYRLIIQPMRQTITASGSGFMQLRFNVNVSEARQVQYYQVEVVEKEGSPVLFKVDQPDANLFINGTVYSDLSNPIRLQPGTIDIRLEAEGYRPIEETIRITEETVFFEYEMKSIDPVILTITTNVPGTTVLIDGVEAGTIDNQGILQLFRFPGNYQITAKLAGYVRTSKEILVSEASANEINFTLQKNAGTLRFTVTPSDATILVNGNSVEKEELIEFVPGGYRIEVSRSGYLSEEYTVDLELGDALTFNYELVKNAGTLIISTTPAETQILVNKQPLQPNTNTDFAPGRYRIEISRAGYDSITEDLTIERGELYQKKFTLNQQFGKLQFLVRPSSANVTLRNDQGQKVEDWTGLKIINQLPVGRYTLEVSADEYKSKSESIEIQKNQTSMLEVVMEEGSDITFYLADNGITVKCEEAEFGESGEVNGVTYTKRTKDEITITNAANTCTSGITDMSRLFRNADAFNQDISAWDVSQVREMRYMFSGADEFNQDIGAWDVSQVTNMNSMFSYAGTFNQDIGAWDVSKVKNMNFMFRGAATFNQDLSKWCVSNISSIPVRFEFNAPLTIANNPKWGTCPAN